MSSYRQRLREQESYQQGRISDHGIKQSHPYQQPRYQPNASYNDDNDELSTVEHLPGSDNSKFGFNNMLAVPSDMAGYAIGFVSVIGETLLSHPFIVIRRQCQIRHDSLYFHITPFTILPIMINISRTQGFGSLWKGIGSVFMVRGIGLLSETAICEVTPLPKEVTRHSSLKKLSQHLLLKGLTLSICAPFYAASLVEIVQSEIASDPPGIFNCIREGLLRITLLSSTSSNRMLTLWRFLPPVVLLGLSQYVIRGIVSLTTRQYLNGDDVEDERAADVSRDGGVGMEEMYERYYCELVTSFTSSLVADIMCYPLETVVQRLCIQGTRTLVDNTDTGLSVAPVTTAYDGFLDAIRCMLAGEAGGTGLYKGFGALVLQYLVQFALLRTVKWSYERLLITYGHERGVTPGLNVDERVSRSSMGSGRRSGSTSRRSQRSNFTE